MLNTFFGFKGRIGRGSWWLAQLIAIPVVYLFGFAALAGLGMAIPEGGEANAMTGGGAIVAIIAAIAVAIWINVASSVKRYHDRGKSGVWFLIIFVPFIGGFWQLIECGFCSGDDGVNDYGPPGGRGADGYNDSPVRSSGGGLATADGSGKLAQLDDDYFRKYAAQTARMAEPVVQSTYARPATTVSAPGGFGGKPTFGRR